MAPVGTAKNRHHTSQNKLSPDSINSDKSKIKESIGKVEEPSNSVDPSTTNEGDQGNSVPFNEETIVINKPAEEPAVEEPEDLIENLIYHLTPKGISIFLHEDYF